MTAALTPVTDLDTQRRVTEALTRELEPRFAGTLTLDQVCSGVRDAVADLRGSVCVEALPEMAARLAHYRLQAKLHAGLDTATPPTRTVSEPD